MSHDIGGITLTIRMDMVLKILGATELDIE